MKLVNLKEATEAAKQRLPVIHNGIEYLRIKQAGYDYDDQGNPTPVVQLLDKCKHSVSYADPARVTLKEETPCTES